MAKMLIGAGTGGGSGTVTTDGVTIQGNGSVATPIALLDAITDGVTLQGAGISSSKLALKAVSTDGVTLQGAGVSGNSLALKAVQTAARLTGAGTVASPLDIAGWPITCFAIYDNGNGQTVTANKLSLTAFPLPYALTFAHIGLRIITDDATHDCDIGLYNSAGTLVANIGAQTIGSTGNQTFATVQGSQTISPGLYWFAITSAASNLQTGLIVGQFGGLYNSTGFGSSTGGALPSSITPPALSLTNASLSFALL